MKLIVNAHKIELIKEEAVNEKEINISNCKFEFSEEYTDDLVKEAYFTLDGKTYKQIIVDNESSYPPEVLVKEGTVELGVVAYDIAGSEYVERFNPSPVYFQTIIGSLKDNAENSQEITPSELEQYEQALNDGLAQAQNVDIDAIKIDDTATISITNRYGEVKTVDIVDGEKGEDGQPGITPNIQVGNTTTLPAGSNATVTQRGTTENPIFDFGIPKGEDGESGGSNNYTELSNKPKINNVELNGNKTTSELGINIPDVSNFITKDVNDLTNYYKKTETYTKTEVDNKVSSVYRYRGTVQTYSDLPSTDLVVGDVYNIEQADSEHGIQAGDNVAWNGTAWDKLSGNVDLSGYQPLLVSGSNIKSLNNTSLLGNGNLDINGSLGDLLVLKVDDSSTETKNKIGQVITDHYSKGLVAMVQAPNPVLLYNALNSQNETYIFQFAGVMPYYDSTSYRKYYYFQVSGSWSDNVYTVTTISYHIASLANYNNWTLTTSNAEQYIPTADSYNPATAKYAEAKALEVKTQYSTMPTASSTNLGQIVQFTGTTGNDYTNGYFYQCVVDNNVYSWVNVNVQPGSSSNQLRYYIVGDHLIYNITPGNYSVVPNSTSIITKTKLPLSEVKEALQLAYANNKYLILHIYTTTVAGAFDYRFGNYITNFSTQTSDAVALITNASGGQWFAELHVTYDNNFDLFGVTCNGVSQISIGMTNTNTYTPTIGSYNPATALYAEKMVESVAPVYNSSSSYAVGDYCSRQGKLYKCTTAIVSGENWNASHWTETTAMGVIGNINTVLENIVTVGGNE